MKIWTLATQKGGAGKTTLLTNLAVFASQKKKKVLIIDLDVRQQSARKWWERREAESPEFVTLKHNQLAEGLEEAKNTGFDLVLIDTAGFDTLEHHEAIKRADMTLVPCQPSMADMEAVVPTIELLRRLERPFAFIMTQCPPVFGELERSAKVGLTGLGVVSPIYNIWRKSYKLAFAMGEGITESTNKKASEETEALFNWVTTKERKLNR
jgi:chromosome partitioning protein